jgi:hypothetical protein
VAAEDGSRGICVYCPRRFDVLATDNRPGMPPEVRLHKDAFSPQMVLGAGRSRTRVAGVTTGVF